MIKNCWLLLILIVLMFSCTEQLEQENKTFILDPECQITYPFSDFMTIEKVIALETTEEGIISHISRVIIDNKRLYIFSERKGVLVFNNKGKYLFSIGRVGRGPYELINPTDFDLSPEGDEIAIWDRDGGKLLIYSLDGKCLRRVDSRDVKWGFRFCWLEKNKFLLSSLYSPQRNIEGKFQLYFMDDSLNVVKGEIPYDEKLEGLGAMGKVFQKYDDGSIQFRHPTEGSVYLIKEKLKKSYEFDFGDYQLENERRRKYIEKPILAYEDFIKSNKAILINFIDLNGYYYGCYALNGKHYSFLVNKHSAIQRRYRHTLSLDYLSDVRVIGYVDGKLLAFIEPYKLKEKLLKVSTQDRKKFKEDILYWESIVKDKPDTDNPILVFLKPKKF